MWEFRPYTSYLYNEVIMHTDNQIEELIAGYLSGQATREDAARLMDWIQESPENRRYYQRLRNVWQVASPAFPADRVDVLAAHDKVMRQIDRRKWYQSAFARYWQYAAAILLLPLLILSSYLYISGRQMTYAQVSYQEVFAPYGTHARISLPDGSIVWLNAGSTLKYPTVFKGKERNVALTGEAFFEVESDPQNPFVVQTSRMEVSAVGTAFNVEAYRGDSIVSVTMVQGKVHVSLGNAHPFSLTAGERMGYNLNTASCRIVKTDPYKWYAWKDGSLVFRDDPLEYVFKKIGQTFNIDIVVKDPNIARHPYRATFQRESLDEILRLLRMTAPIRYENFDREKAVDNQYEKQRIEVYRIKN